MVAEAGGGLIEALRPLVGFIEFILIYGVVIALLIREYIKTDKLLKKKDQEKEE